MKNMIMLFAALLTSILPVTTLAGTVSSASVIEQQRSAITKQQILSMVETDKVQQQLVALGVSPDDAKQRINNLTNAELASLNNQINDAPAGSGVVGTIFTVLLVVAVLDLLGVTDAYSFIDPI
ncbi:PA2779 family protein [Thalassotalea piscium]|uniref:Mg2+ and Co2+ transporter CorA n=1 Tax=Thalassotalea piscium TaxID=1230533 RepID=A0A7X0NJ54_9GAMM|nr:PA2779 family protein [Thalassotalea piscium]MBB6544370.1 Mg2+ and Co2+ transporter CorA [Thalassotalea piscium]